MEQQRDYTNQPECDSVALWKRQTKTGEVFVSGIVKVEGKEYKLIAFLNKTKVIGDKRPDFKYSSAKEIETSKAQQTQQQSQVYQNNTQPIQQQNGDNTIKVEDIPF
jgi:hypothetical protein